MKIHILSTLILLLIFNISSSSQQNGNATYYSNKLYGRHTSDGGKYHPDSMTCAHRTYPLGTILKIRNPKNNKEVILKVTDRGPFQKRLMVDVSYCAAKVLDIVRLGIAQVEVTKLDAMPFIIPSLFSIPIPFPKVPIQSIPIMLKMNDMQTSNELSKK
ncbi:MAG: septal ring lytic transglycosylase RlpA family protein [Paludibacter sp.]